MKSSGNLSATPINRPPSAPTRSSFSLLGPSVTLDPRTNAVRRDLADIRLADRVFAPHYAAPLMMTVTADVTLTDGYAADCAVIAHLADGEPFEVLELARGRAWGIAPAHRLVGYVDAAALSVRAA